MGMFDTLHCEYPLPDPAHNALTFQTKSLDNCMIEHTITAEGRLIEHQAEGNWVEGDETKEFPHNLGYFEKTGQHDRDLNWHGYINFYDCIRENQKVIEWIEYQAKFTDGTLVEVKRIEWMKPVTTGSLADPQP